MSSIYVLEPPTNGRVVLHTTVGAIDIELWSKEAPKACRNFVQLCMEAYYDGTIFHRVVKGFIVQGGDPTGTGSGGDSVYGAPFGLELHSRLRFNRRGLVAMACLQPGQSASQFFFTLAATPELEKHNTIFGQVAGNSLFNMLRLGECETDQQERPLYPHSVQRAEVVACPFGDVAPREEQLLLRRQQRQQAEAAAAASASSKRRPPPRSEAKATKNFALLSFGDEAADDEEQELAGRKAKKVLSSHDLLDDPRLSSETAPILPVAPTQDDAEAGAAALTKSRADAAAAAAAEADDAVDESRDSRLARLKREVAQMRRALHKAGPVVVPAEPPPPPPLQQQHEEKKKATDEEEADAAVAAKRRKRRRGSGDGGGGGDGDVEDAKAAREAATLRLLAKFTAKMAAAAASADDNDAEAADEADQGGSASAAGLFSHVFLADSAPAPRRVIDASLAAAGGAAEADRFELDDPRNPMNKRRRKAAADKAAAAGGSGRGGGRSGRSAAAAAKDDLL